MYNLFNSLMAGFSRNTYLACMTLFVCALLPTTPGLADGDLCIVKNDWVTGPPLLTDGDVAGDVGYTGATRAELGKALSGVPYAGFVRMVEDRDGSGVWLGLEIAGLASNIHSVNDVALIAFSTGSGTDTFIKIRPFALNDTSLDTPDEIIFKMRPAGTEVWTDAPTPAWASTNMRKVVDGDKSVWILEMKIPKAATAADALASGIYFGEPISDPTLDAGLKVYINIMRTTDVIFPGFVTETPWPRDALIENIIPPATSVWDLNSATYSPIPPATDWADVSLGRRNQCDGVSLALQDIGTTNVPDNEIRLHMPGGSPLTTAMCPPATGQENNVSVTNTFKAIPERSAAGVAASDITVTYKIAKWGIPGLEDCGIGVSRPDCWSHVATSDTGSITSGTRASAATFNAPWQPTYQVSCNYLGNTDNCMTATMSSTSPDVKFINDSVRRNMTFVSASRYEKDATISAKGYGAPANGSGKHRFLVVSRNHLDDYQSNRGRFLTHDGGQGTGYVEVMTWTAQAFLTSSKKIKIGNRDYTVADEVGGFGYVASHEGMTAEWSQSLTGDDLVGTDDPDAFTLDIEPGGEAIVTTVIEAEDYRYAVNGVLGITDPVSSFSNLVDSGLSLGLGVEYLFSNQLAAELSLGWHAFDDNGLGTDLDILRLSLNARYYYLIGNSSLFVNGGIGVYDLDPGSSESGVNAGFGYQYRLTRRLNLEAAYNYHDVAGSSPDVTFSTLQLGLRYLF